jgi:HAD superfamily hydrolase (TIGR01484 family)
MDDATWAALRRLRHSGRKIIMVTGRELDELLGIIAHPELFDRIVAENGALVYEPATREVRLGAAPPPASFVEELRRRGVDRVAVGRVIVATWEPHQATVLEVIRHLGLELQVVFNKGAVMVLPSGVNKATGLGAALLELGLSPHNAVGVGDAENDHALLELCECGVAVANALPSLKARADWTTTGDHGGGVIELCERLIREDLASIPLLRHHVLLGKGEHTEITIDPYAESIMVSGTSGSGKSTLTTGFLERLSERTYQFMIIDPEGDYASLDIAVVLGATERAPLVSEVLDVLRDPTRNAVINLLGLSLEDRPKFFSQLLAALSDLRMRTGRPHWTVIDEAHHLLPATWKPAAEVGVSPRAMLYITVHPGSVSPNVIASIGAVVAVGANPDETLAELCQVTSSEAPPRVLDVDQKLSAGEALYWKVGWPRPVLIRTPLPKTARKRHSRKYMEGNLGAERSFYYRGPEGKLNLKAQNLRTFIDLGAGVDDQTWDYHLREGHYSPWVRLAVKDPELASEVERIEQDAALSAQESRAAVRAAVDKRYTLPSDRPSGFIDA